MATRPKNTRKTTRVNSTPATRKRRSPVASRKTRKGNSSLNFVIPAILLLGILGGLGFLLFKGYQTVTASSFFDVRRIDVSGNARVSNEDIEKIVRAHTSVNGTWRVELDAIKADIEKIGDDVTYFKNVTVLRVLPDAIQVRVEERAPRAIIRTTTGDFWVDDEAARIGVVGKNEPRTSFILKGWDELKTDRSMKENQERVRLFVKLKADAQALGVEKRISSVNLQDLQDVQVSVDDSNQTVLISLGKEDFGNRLKRAMTVVEGKGQTMESLKSYGGNVVATYRNN